LVFQGSDGLDELPLSNFDFASQPYCGLNPHGGYVKELREIIAASMNDLRPRLSKCRTVTVTGHSLGGSLAHIFSACANSGNVRHRDFIAQSWPRGRAEAQRTFDCRNSRR
jgi:hypothetical protein